MPFKQLTFSFKNKGIVQKLDSDLREPGQFHALENFDSDAEGSIISTKGTTAALPALPAGAYLHTLARFRPSSVVAEQRYYAGHGNLIHRAAGTGGTFAQIYQAPTAGDRFWSTLDYDGGSSGKLIFFLAHPDAMLKDTGGLATLHRWGILPPAIVASGAAVAVSAIDVPTGDAGADLATTLTGAGWGQSSYNLPAPVDLSRGGYVADGYDSEDPIHVVIALDYPARFLDIRLQFDVSDTPGAFTDYYEKPIKPSGLSGYIAQSETAQEAVTERMDEYDRGLLSQYPMEEDYTRQLQPVEIAPFAGGTETQDVYIPKKEFLKVGNAGSTGKTWANINAIRLTASTSEAATVTVSTVELQGGLGPNSEASGRQKYKYRYCYRNPVTNAESNPSPEMIEESGVAANRQPINVTVTASSDAQISGAGSIAIYRMGGALTDGIYRLVGYAENHASGFPNTVVFQDTVNDADLKYASKILDLDNDPPVRSTLPEPFLATLVETVDSPGYGTRAVTVLTPAGKTAEDVLTPGSTIYVNGEATVVQAVSGNNVSFATQRPYQANAQMTCGSVVGQPCDLVCQAFETVFLAGDENNPHVLYQSKKARPEAFPVVNLTTGATCQVKVSSPANPIMAITDIGDRIACLCLSGISAVGVFGGVMRSPEESASQRGLIAKRAWSKAPNGEIWFLSYDGVYSWTGGRAQLRSYAINGMFTGKEQNGYKPVDMTAAALPYITFGCAGNRIRIACKDTDGNALDLIYDLIEERWHIRRAPKGAATWLRTTAYLTESDTGRLLIGRSWLSGGAQGAGIYADETSDGADPTIGVTCICQTPFFTGGEPALQKLLGDIAIDLSNPVEVTVKVYYDFDLSAPAETLTIPAGPGHRWTYPLPIETTGSKTNGKEFRAVALRFEVTTTQRVSLHSITYSIAPLTHVQRGRVVDWTPLEWPHDKRLDQVHFIYDTKGQTVTLYLDIVSGISGNTEELAVASFTLTGSGRSNVTLPIKRTSDGTAIVAKMIRLRTATPVTNPILMFGEPDFRYEKYPPDIIYFTEPTDSGYAFTKYYQQLVLDVDTGGVAASVTVEVDGTDKGTFSITTTAQDRKRQITLAPSISGRQARLKISPGVAGKFQLFSDPRSIFIVAPADKGAVVHTWDWDDLGHPFDKRLKTVTLEYNVTEPATVRMDRLSGLTGTQGIATIMDLSLTAGGRRKETFAVTGAPIAKMVRLYPLATNADFKEWKYIFDKVDYPADVTPETEYDNCGYAWEKILRAIRLVVDTNGQPVTCTLWADGTAAFTFQVTGTDTDRVQPITPPKNVIGKMFKIVPTLGPGVKFQLFEKPYYEVIHEPIPLTKWSSYELVFGYDGPKIIKQMWVEYLCSAGIRVKIYVDGGALFYTKDLPAHTVRNVERFFLPPANGAVLNKSKVYVFDVETLSAAVPFKMYRDGTRVNTKVLNADQRAGYFQSQIWETMQTMPA